MTDWELKEVIRSCRLVIKRARQTCVAVTTERHAESMPAYCVWTGRKWLPEWSKTFQRDEGSRICMVKSPKYLQNDLKSGQFIPIFA